MGQLEGVARVDGRIVIDGTMTFALGRCRLAAAFSSESAPRDFRRRLAHAAARECGR
jgi:hypothetical protein